MSEVFNGIDGATGRYLPAEGRLRARLTPRELREYIWWTERHGIDDPNRAPTHSVDPRKIEEAGWGVIFAEDVRQDVKDALKPLLKQREDEAGPYYKELSVSPTTTKLDFLARHGMGPGPADPKKIPYYLLIVGSPRSISYRFQYDLDVQYAVGRLYFETVEEYKNYVRGIQNAAARPPRLTFFGVENPNDSSTHATANLLISPLVDSLSPWVEGTGWEVQSVLREEARKVRLSRLLGGDETPALLFSACHGMAFEPTHELYRRHQGALLCQDWKGPKQPPDDEPIPPHWYLSADDLADEASVSGLIAFHLACYSAGMPESEGFDMPTLGRSGKIQGGPFISSLAQRLLGHPGGGALAVLGHVDRAWTLSFKWPHPDGDDPRPGVPKVPQPGNNQGFESVLRRLLEGHPVGSAMEYINQQHAELAVALSGLWRDKEQMAGPSRSHFDRVSRATEDAKNFVVLGDPAVRVQGPVVQGKSDSATAS
jgi:hypothetical protein